MVINSVAATTLSSTAPLAPKQEFSKLLSGRPGSPVDASKATAKPAKIIGPGDAAEGHQIANSSVSARAIDRVSAAQRSLDQVLASARAGKTFSPAELLAMQAQVYRASQELDLAGKVVEKVTSGVKQILQTQV